MHTIKLLITVSFLSLTGCAGGSFTEEAWLTPGSRSDEIYREQTTGDDKNLGPNAPGYLGTGGEYQIYQDNDPR